MSDPVEDIIGNYKAFAAQQRDRVAARGIDVTPYAISHIAYRVPDWDQYLHVRGLLERHAVANRGPVLTGQQFQGPTPGINDPYYILFEDFTHVKFHQRALRETAEMTGSKFNGFQHLDSYAPQRLVTATGPNALPD